MAIEESDKTPSATYVEIPQTMLQQAAAAAQANADDDTPLGRESTREFLTSQATEDESHVPPPAYGDKYGDVSSSVTGMGTQASLTADGRINVNINQTSHRLSSLLVPALRSQLDLVDTTEAPPPYIPASLGGEPGQPPPPPLNVVIHVVGSRGDVQPFVALGKVLKEKYGHRVRLATHPVFRDFVNENGLEFFSIGGDPAELMAFMVKNPGLMPGFDTLRSGDIGKRRKEISTMIKGCWRSCIESGDGTGVPADDNTAETWMSNVNTTDKPFIADAIIANPPSFAHIHCAEKLGVPLHIMFTMPYSPTQAFPHPLANIQSTNADPNVTNFITYAMVDMLTWQGLGDVINRLRVKQLSLDPINLIWAPGMLQRLRIPHTYCWSPALIPKPKDWGNQISISGFYFLSLASNFTPDPDLKAFLDTGPPPVYIGFGSIVVDDPNAMTKLIFDAVRKTGQRALVSKGWGGIGADQLGIPDGVFMLGNVPHDWLFKRVSCVVHHGGAGTTAAGIACGKPTVIVPFFGDQPFWGAMVAKAGAGPQPIAYKDLTADTLAESIQTALEPASKERAQELADSINHEKGTDTGAQSFHQFLEVDNLRCSIAPSKAAVWRLKRTDVRLSALAATVLAQEGLLDFKDLKLYRARDYEADEGPPDPFSGGGGALIGTISSMMMGVADFPVAALKALRIHPDSVPKKSAESQGATEASSTEQTSTQASSSTRSVASEAPTPVGGTFNLDESLAKMGSSHLSHQNTPEQGVKRSRSSSLAAALRGQFDERIRHRSNSRSGSSSRSASQQGEKTPKDKAAGGDLQEIIDAAFGTGKGVSRIVGAGFKSPMDFTHALAKGFHNAPKLYGDESVRKPDRVTDFRSGLRAATKEFGFGMYDGITGLVTQPLAGAKKEGAAGFVKGIGKGIGGIVLKPSAAALGIPAYTMKGVYKELQALSGSSVQNYIIAARTAQGYDEWHRSNGQERQDMILRWRVLQSDIKKKKFAHEHVQEAFKRQWQNAHNRSGKAVESDSESSVRGHSRTATADSIDGAPSIDVSAPPAYDDLDFTRTTPAEMEKAIRTSVADTSRGDPEEDALIERAIRASVAELSSRTTQASTGSDEGDDYQRAIAASMAEIKKNRGDDLGDDELEKALKASLDQQGKRSNALNEEEMDDEIRLAIKASQEQQSPHHKSLHTGSNDDEDAELEKAISQSQATHNTQSKQEEEERIVLEYIKKQSLMEEEHRQMRVKGKGKEEQPNEEDDEELKRAMEMSLKKEGQEGGRA